MKPLEIVKLVMQIFSIIMEIVRQWKAQEKAVPKISKPGMPKDVMTGLKKSGFDEQTKEIILKKTGIELTPLQLEMVRDRIDQRLNPKRKYKGAQKP